MRFSNLVLGVAGVVGIAASALAGCGSSSSTGTGASGTGASGAGAGTTTSTTGTKSATTTATSMTTTSTSMHEPCSPKPSCPSPAAAVGCVGLVDNTGKTKFGLRMSQLDVVSPPALSKGVVATVIGGAVELNEPACNLSGSATFNWLLQFDTGAGTLTTGGAKPVTDPTKGYSFDTDTVQGFSLAPIVVNTKPDASGSFGTAMGHNLIVPIFLDAAGDMVVLLPLQAATISMGKLTEGQNCVGTYNAATLDPANACVPDATHPQYTDGGSLDGFITLKDANNVVISTLNESLCVLLSGGASQYVTTKPGSSETICTTDASGNVVYQGNWCSSTNAAAANGCADSVALSANFAASSVQIN